MRDGSAVDSGAGVGSIDGGDGATTDEEEAALTGLLGGKAIVLPAVPGAAGAVAKPKGAGQLDASLSLALRAADTAAARDAADAGLPPLRLLGQPAVLGGPPGGAGLLGGQPIVTPKSPGAPSLGAPRLDLLADWRSRCQAGSTSQRILRVPPPGEPPFPPHAGALVGFRVNIK